MTKRVLEPWHRTWAALRQRCLDQNYQSFHRYGGRGIKPSISKEELKELWFRDKAYLLDSPTIDRIDNDGNYSYKNCRYIENRVNAGVNREKTNCRNGHPFKSINLYMFYSYDGHLERRCMICARASRAKYRMKKQDGKLEEIGSHERY